MVIDHFRKNPALVVRIFRDFGQRELNLMVAFGFVFGFLLGIPVAIVDQLVRQWWLLPILGVVVGWMTNALGHVADLRAAEPRTLARHQGPRAVPAPPGRGRRGVRADHRRRRDHPREIGDFLLDGPSGDRTRQMLADRAAARDRPGRRAGAGAGPRRGRARRFDTIRDSVAREAVDRTHRPRSRTPSSAARQAERIYALIARRTKELPPRDFVEMMRSAIKEDEWMLYAHGAIMGLAGGFLHLSIFGVSGWPTTRCPTTRRDPPVPAGPHLSDAVGPADEALPGVARVAASAWWHTTGWGCGPRRARAALAWAVTTPTRPARWPATPPRPPR